MKTSKSYLRWLVSGVVMILIAGPGLTPSAHASVLESAVSAVVVEEAVSDGNIVPLGPSEGVIRYHCYFAGGSAVEFNIRYCRNASVNIVQDGKVIGKVSTDSSGRPYVGGNPNWYCVAAVASGVIGIFTAGGVKVGWVAASWILNAIGLYGSCKIE
ncbi:MAG: hypothetical protein Q4G35_09365 [Propionibacteriaceae bacterium]|nr:hypothetical protein [Propionibacteriaceae bacterium]